MLFGCEYWHASNSPGSTQERKRERAHPDITVQPLNSHVPPTHRPQVRGRGVRFFQAQVKLVVSNDCRRRPKSFPDKQPPSPPLEKGERRGKVKTSFGCGHDMIRYCSVPIIVKHLHHPASKRGSTLAKLTLLPNSSLKRLACGTLAPITTSTCRMIRGKKKEKNKRKFAGGGKKRSQIANAILDTHHGPRTATTTNLNKAIETS